MSSTNPEIDCTTLFSNCLGVFQGGGCRAIAYVGAFRKAVDKGIAFSEVAGTSAGAIFAALIAAGATPDFLKKIAYSPELKNIPSPIDEQRKGNWVINAVLSLAILKNTVKKKLRRNNTQALFDFEPVKNHRRSLRALIHRFGIFDSANIKRTMDDWLKELTGIDNITFSQLKLPLYVFASDVVNKKCRMWSKDTAGDTPVAEAVAASCSIPFYFSPVRLDDGNSKEAIYVDGGILSNRPDFIAKDKPNYFQTLSFKLESKEASIDSLADYAGALIDTVIYGADQLQHMKVGVDDETFGRHHVNEVPISVGISAIDFSKLTPSMIDGLLEAGETGMESFINVTDGLLKAEGFKKYAVTPRRILADREQMYNQIAFWSYEKYDSIIVADCNLDWVWSLLPTLVSWINRGTRVSVFYNSALVNDSDPVQNAKKRLAEYAGCKVEPVEPERLITGFFFRNADDYKCVMFEESNADSKFCGKVYNDAVDSHFIKVLLSRLLSDTHQEDRLPHEITLQPVDISKVTESLRQLPPYSHASFEFKEVPIKQLRFLKDSVRSLKYKELRHIIRLYRNAGLPEYSPAQLVLSGKNSLMTPVIVENHPDIGLVVIKGNARCLKCHNEKKASIQALVVSGAETIDNGITSFDISDIRLSEHKNRGSVKKVLDVFRQVDQALRPNLTYLE